MLISGYCKVAKNKYPLLLSHNFWSPAFLNIESWLSGKLGG